MKRLLVIKTGAAGDILRTTPLLHVFRDWEVDWLVAKENKELIMNEYVDRVLDNPTLIDPHKTYDLIINLEDDEPLCENVFSKTKFMRIFGSYVDGTERIRYTDDSAEWFDMGLIGRYGIKAANELKLKNRSSYQEIIFRALGHEFHGEPYIMPFSIPKSQLTGDIAIALKAGDRWPIKTWYHLRDLANDLSKAYEVNILPPRKTILEHVADIKGHKFVISPDSLPMHIALGLGTPCLAIFTCTSPWEIYDYNLLTKVVSPKLERYFYSRECNEDAVKCIPYREVYEFVVERLKFHKI